MPGETAAVEAKQKETAAPAVGAPGFAAPSFGSIGTRSHEQAILNLQQSAGNRAVRSLFSGVQRAPADPGLVQRAPADAGRGAGMNAERRAELIRQAIDDMPLGNAHILTVKVDQVAEAMEGMTAQDGRDLRVRFAERFKWSLRDLIADRLEIDGKQAKVLGVGPKNQRRLNMLLRGTVASPTPDPMDALEKGQALGQLIGVVTGHGDEIGSTLGALAAVSARDEKALEEKEAGTRRRTAQAIELRGWLDKGQNDRVLSLVRNLSTPGRLDERKALSDAYEAEFGEGLYIALTKRIKNRIDFQRVGALWDNDLTKDDRLATEAKVERVKKAEAAVPKLPEGIKPENLVLGADAYKAGQQRIRDAKAELDAHLDEMSNQPAVEAGPAESTLTGTGGPARTRLDAALGEGEGAAGVKYEIGRRSGVKADDLFDPSRRPLVIADRLAQKYKDGLIKAADVEGALKEVRSAADAEGARRMREAAAKRATTEAGGADDPAASSPGLVVDGHFAQFRAEFEAKAGKPLMVVMSGLGSPTDRRRNRALLAGQGAIDEVAELNFAVIAKDMDRLRSILGDKTGPEIRDLAHDYRERYRRDLGTALLGTPDEIRRIRNPTPDDLINGRLPKDLPKARKDLDEKLMLLKGAYAYEPSGSIKAQLDFVEELSTTRASAGTGAATGAVPVSDRVFEGLADQAGTQADKEAVREEARHVLSRILRREITVDTNRGLYAKARDEFGNIDRRIVRQTRDDALGAVQKLDQALEQDPPNIAVARGQITTLYIAEERMKHNLGVYEERTEEAFNAFVDLAVLVASTIATAGAGGVIASAVRATAATLATKLIAKGPDYLTSPELLADLRGGVFSIAGGKLADKVVGRFVQGWAKGIIGKVDELGAAAGFGARASAAGAKAALYGADQAVSGIVSGGLESAVQGKIDPLVDQFTPTAQGMALAQGGAHKLMKGARARYDGWQDRRAQQKARTKAAAGTAPSPAPEAAVAAGPTASASTGTADGPGAAPVASGPGLFDTGQTSRGAEPTTSPTGDVLHAVSPTMTGVPAVPARTSKPPRRRRGSADHEVPLTPDEFEVPEATMSNRELGLPENSSARRRRNKQEQLRREGALPGPDGALPPPRFDMQLLADSTGPTRGRRFAAEFVPIREGWLGLSLEARTTRIETVVNTVLADAGMPNVRVVADPNLMPGSAAFIPTEWTIVVSAHEVLDPSPEGFGDLAEAVAHESRHALHLFRGLRAKLAGNPAFSAPVRADVLQRAAVVNRIGGFDEKFRLPDRNRPGDRGSEAFGEAVDVIEETFGPGTRDRPTAVAAGAEANRRTADLRAALDERNAAAAARPVDPARVQRAEVGVAAAARRQWEAHNLYVKTAPEADAFRAGPAARKATIELIQRQQELVDAKLFHARATAELDAAMVTGNADRIRAAVDRAEPLQARVREAQAEVDALTRLAPDPNLAASLGAESLVPPPRERDEVLPVPAAGAAAAAPQPAPPPSGAPSSPGAPARPQLPGARLRSTRPEGLSGNDPSASRPLAGRVGDGGPLDRETRKHMLVERARQRRAGGGTRELRGSIDDAVEDSIVEETGITPDPAVQPRLPRPQSRGRGKAARAAFRSLRDDYAGELGVTEGGQVHHAIELQVLDRYPGVFTEAELNSFENMRGIATENNRRRQLHNSHVRRRWDRAYRALNAAIRSRRLQPGSPEYRAVVRTSLEDARREIDTFNGTMFTEYRSGRQTGGTSRDDAEDRSE